MKVKLFASVSTEAKFNTLKVSTSASNDAYRIGDGETVAGKPDILWNWVVFIQDTKKIWNRGLIYNEKELAGVEYNAEENTLTATLADGTVLGSDIPVIKNYIDDLFLMEGEILKTDDAARYILGGDWRIPTDEEWDSILNGKTWTNDTTNKVASYGGLRLPYPSDGKCYWTNRAYPSERVYAVYPGYFSNGHPTLSVESREDPLYIKAVCPKNGNTNGVEYIDLGGDIVWAKYNVGASAENELGDTFKWAEIEPSTDISWDTYKFSINPGTNSAGRYTGTFSKYVLNSAYGEVDNKEYLETSYTVTEITNKYYTYLECDNKYQPKGNYASSLDITEINNFIDNNFKGDPKVDDAARYNWGGDWRMPTLAEILELLDFVSELSEDKFKLMGNYYVIISNELTLIFPTNTYWAYESELLESSEKVYIRSSERLHSEDDYKACYLRLSKNSDNSLRIKVYDNTSDTLLMGYKETGLTVRPVCSAGGDLNGHNGIDLGLPSGLLWADRNLGANSVAEVGDYYLWGSVTPIVADADGYNYTIPLYGIWDENDNYFVFSKYNEEDGDYILDYKSSKYYTKEEVDEKLGPIENNLVIVLDLGELSAVVKDSGNSATGDHAFALGVNSNASGYAAFSENGNATGPYSHSEGGSTTASGKYSHAEGYQSEASGESSHAEGNLTKSLNEYEHSEGRYNKSISGSTDDSKTIHTIGKGTLESNRLNLHLIMYNGDQYIYGLGGYDGTNSHNADNTRNTDVKTLLEVIGAGINEDSLVYVKGDGDNSAVLRNSDSEATEELAIAEGSYTVASGYASHTEGSNTLAKGDSCHAEGLDSVALGNYSHAEGEGFLVYDAEITLSKSTSFSSKVYVNEILYEDFLANGQIGHFLYSGYVYRIKSCGTDDTGSYINVSNNIYVTEDTTVKVYYYGALGKKSHVEGEACTTTGTGAHAEGYITLASGNYSHAEGNSTGAEGGFSHTEGDITTAKNDYEHAEGKGNLSLTGTASNSKTLHTIGIGGLAERKNAEQVMFNGDLYIYGIGGFNGANSHNADGTRNTNVKTLQEVISAGVPEATIESLKEEGAADGYVKASDVYKIIHEIELATAAALNDLNTRIQELTEALEASSVSTDDSTDTTDYPDLFE